MKSKWLIFWGLLLLTSCEKVALESSDETEDGKHFTFTVKGDFGNPLFTRAYLQADGNDMTDLWVFDYVDGICVQSLHQAQTDADFGAPKMTLSLGQHHIYFVASRGTNPTVDETNHTISWDMTRDTFWKDYTVTVVPSSNGHRAVELARVATRLRLSITDEVPEACAAILVTPTEWYYALDYTTGDALQPRNLGRKVTVPASYVGTSGQLSITVYGLSRGTEWTTDIHIDALNADDMTIGSADIVNAPFERNRSTEYSGPLFSGSGSMSISLNDTWSDSVTGTW